MLFDNSKNQVNYYSLSVAVIPLIMLPLLSLISLVSAAPYLVTVTQTVVTTVIVDGQAQTINDAPVIEATSTPLSTSGTSIEYLPTTLLTVTPETSSETTTTTPETTEAIPETTLETTPTTTSATTTEATSSATTSAAAATAGSDFESQILNEHNVKRALHGVPNLSWDATLASYAQAYADKYDCSGTLTHSGGQYGENLALGYTITGSVDAWYSEGDNYNYGSACSVYDHFTQVVWESTTKVGCGYKKCDDYWGTYIICSYDPAGNFVGQCDSNVLPLV